MTRARRGLVVTACVVAVAGAVGLVAGCYSKELVVQDHAARVRRDPSDVRALLLRSMSDEQATGALERFANEPGGHSRVLSAVVEEATERLSIPMDQLPWGRIRGAVLGLRIDGPPEAGRATAYFVCVGSNAVELFSAHGTLPAELVLRAEVLLAPVGSAWFHFPFAPEHGALWVSEREAVALCQPSWGGSLGFGPPSPFPKGARPENRAVVFLAPARPERGG